MDPTSTYTRKDESGRTLKPMSLRTTPHEDYVGYE